MAIRNHDRLIPAIPNKPRNTGMKYIAAIKRIEIATISGASLLLYLMVCRIFSVKDRFANVRKMLLITNVMNTSVLVTSRDAVFIK